MIECQLCHKQFRAITVSHLRWMHNMTTARYKELYGEKSLTPPEAREARSATSGHLRCYNKGQIPWNKGKKGLQKDPKKGLTYEEFYGEERAKEIRKIQSIVSTGKKMNFSKETLDLFREKCKVMNAMDRTGIGAKISKSLKGKLSGSKNPNWRGGKNEYEDFDETIKELVRKRSHRCCVVCGKTEKENGRKLDVHHIDHNKKNSSYYNLVALCHPCHTKETYGKIIIRVDLVDTETGQSVFRTIVDTNPEEIIIPKHKKQVEIFEW